MAHQLIYAFTWTIVHSIWVGLLTAILTRWALFLLRARTATLRYNFILFAFLSFIVILSAIFIGSLSENNAIQNYHDFFGLKIQSSIADDRSFFAILFYYAFAYRLLIFLLWAGIAAFKIIYIFCGFYRLKNLRSKVTNEVTGLWSDWLSELALSWGVKRKVRLFECVSITSPVTIGLFRPLIILPTGLLTSFTGIHAEAILLHELAHVRRFDYAVNIIQLVFEGLFFFHPGVLWISKALRKEREHCCDDTAVINLPDRRILAEALIMFNEFALRPTSGVLTFGAGDKSEMICRVRRTLDKRTVRKNKNNLLNYLYPLMIAVLLIFLLSIAHFSFRSVSYPALSVSMLKDNQALYPSAINNSTPKTKRLFHDGMVYITASGKEVPVDPKELSELKPVNLSRLTCLTGAYKTSLIIDKKIRGTLKEDFTGKKDGNVYRIIRVNRRLTALFINHTSIPINERPAYKGIVKGILDEIINDPLYELKTRNS